MNNYIDTELECGNGKFISPFEYYYVIVSKQVPVVT